MTHEPRVDPASDPPAEFLRRYLADRDVSCPGCAYNVRNLVGNRCPECGQELVLSVRLSDPKQGSLIAGLIGLAAGAGFGGLLLLYVVISELVHSRGGGPPQQFFLVIIPGLIIHAVAIWIWIRKWNQIRLLSAGVRSSLVLLGWSMPLVEVLLFTLSIN